MKTILENVIRNGKMPLKEISERIDTMYVDGRLSAEERSALVELMHGNARAENEAPDWQTAFRALTARVEALEEKLGDGEEGTAIPAWQPWDGLSAGYAYGAVVTHNGMYWRSTMMGVNVWEPGAPGVDERYWRKVTEEEANDGWA